MITLNPTLKLKTDISHASPWWNVDAESDKHFDWCNLVMHGIIETRRIIEKTTTNFVYLDIGDFTETQDQDQITYMQFGDLLAAHQTIAELTCIYLVGIEASKEDCVAYLKEAGLTGVVIKAYRRRIDKESRINSFNLYCSSDTTAVALKLRFTP